MKKYIVSSGCSYAQHNFDTILDILDSPSVSELQILNVQASASSNTYICNSIISTVHSLLNSGVPSKNILVINNYTQVGRNSVAVPKFFHTEIESKYNGEQITKYREIYHCFLGEYVRMNDKIYSHLIGSDVISDKLKEWEGVQYKANFEQTEPEKLFEDYLSKIVLLQSYLKRNGVTQISFLMNNVFEGWNKDFSHQYNSNTKWELPSLSNSLHISEISPLCNALWESIDFSSIVFHRCRGNKYGGIDEYFIDKFKDIEYLSDEPEASGCFYGNHPNHKVYEGFTIDYIKDKLLDWKKRTSIK